MLRQLKIQNRLVVMATVPILIIAVLAVGALVFVEGEGIRPFGIFALVGLGISIAAAAAIGRSILVAVSEQTSTATAWAAAAKEGPQVSNPETSSSAATVAAPSTDTAAQETSPDLESIKAGLANIVVNLARRSQTLLDRQVDYIDRLESGEEDPDRLEDLFKVDHLATRMRRNAESLLVLANAEPAKRRGGPVDVGDVLRVAMGEVENYQSINLANVDAAQVGAATAVDLAHMVAELMENATQFSAPETSVQVTGTFEGEDRFAITVADQGMGMDSDQLAEANDTLSNPPELSLDMGRSLGFVVVGRLAKRLKADVKLEPGTDAGLTASILFPTSLLLGSTKPIEAPTAETTDVETGDPTQKLSTAAVAEEDESGQSDALAKLLGFDEEAETPIEEDTWTPPEVTPNAPLTSVSRQRHSDDKDEPAVLEEAIPSGDAFENGVEALLRTDESAEVEPPAGLVKRTRGASPSPSTDARPVVATSRNPDQVRSMLSQYRDGLKGGRADGQSDTQDSDSNPENEASS